MKMVGDWRAAALAFVLAAGAATAWLAASTPQVLGTDAPPKVFSAGRAMGDDRAIAAKPHPTGSAEAGLVRAYLLQRMAALGLNPRIQAGEAVENPRWFKGRVAVGGRVENLVGVLPGRDPSLPAVLLMAHSDSVPGSPGAADDAAGVSSILEVIRALKAGSQPRRDIAVLITDGEEAGLLGARAFFASGDPLLKHIGEVVNLEARGGGGRVAMFQTGDRNGAHIALFSGAVRNTNANSLTSEVYKYMPNDTDFTVSKQAGYPGFNFAFIGSEFDYHSPSSTPAALDQGALQHMGDQALAVTRALADGAALPPAAADAAYSDVLGRWVAAYPAQLGGLAILLEALVLGAAASLYGQGQEGPKRLNLGAVAYGAGGTVLVVLVAALVLWAASRLMGIGEFIHNRALLAQYPLMFSGFALLTLGVALSLIGPVQRGRGWTVLVAAEPTRWSAWAGSFCLLFLIGLALQLTYPPMAVLTAWPLAAAAIVMAVTAFAGGGRFQAPISVIAATLVGGLAVAHLGHFADQTFTAVGLMVPMVLALLVAPVVPVLFPLLAGWSKSGASGQMVGLVIALLGAAALAYATVHDPAGARTPMTVQAFYLQDTAAGKAYRASGLDRLDPWSAAVLGAKPERRPVDVLNTSLWLTPAVSAEEVRPVFTSTREGNQVLIRIAPQAGGRELRLALKASAALSSVSIEGLPADILGRAGQISYVRWAAPEGGITLRFTAPATPGVLDLQYAEVKDGWPSGMSPPSKPADRMPWGLSDTTVVLDELKTSW